MSTVVLPPRPPWVVVALDTTGPALALDAVGVVQPPDRLTVAVDADEDLVDLSAVFTPSDDQAHALGYQWLDARHAVLALDSVGLPSGRGTLLVIGRDRAGNTGSVRHDVFIDRPRLHDCTTEVLGAFEVSTAMPDSFSIETTVLAGFDLLVRIEKAFENDTEALGAFTTETEMTSDGI